MKKSVIFGLFSFWMGYAQVGINTTNPNAQLDIRSSNQAAPEATDGMLIPKVDTFPAINPTNDQQGMLVYLTTLSGTNTPGFYYWNNPTTAWIPIGSNNNSAWNLTGNAGINQATNFLGTVDSRDLILRTNNVDNFRIKNDGRIEIGTKGENPTYEGATTNSKKFYLATETSTNNVVFQSSNDSADPVSMYFGASRGDIKTRTINSPNQNISNLFFAGYDGAKFVPASSINARLDGSAAINSMPGMLNFLTTPSGSINSVQRMVIRSNGNVGIGTNSPLERLHVAGRTVFTNGLSVDNAALLYRSNTDYMFLGPQSGSNVSGASIALYGSTNTSGGNAGGVNLNVSENQVRMNYTNGAYHFSSINSTPYTAAFELNDSGLQLGHNSATGSILFNPNNTERMRLTPTGNLGIGSNNPQEKLHVVGKIRMVDGSQGAGKVLTCDANGTAIWNTLSATNAWGLGGNIGTTPTTNFIGTSDNNSVAFRTDNTERARILATGQVGIGTTLPTRKLHITENTISTTNGQLYLEQSGTGDALMHIGNTGARHFNLGLDTSAGNFKIGTSATAATAATTGTLLTIQPTGEVGIGTITPQEKLHVSGPAGLTAIKISNTSTGGATSNVALDFQRGGNANTDWRIYNIGPNLTLGNSGDELATVNDLYQYQGGRFMPMNDATQSLGQGANRWNTLFASNGTINTSDATEKKNIQNLNYGLSTLMQLRPVSFEWKKDDGSGTKLGLIAQELQQVIPEVVRDWDWEEDEFGNRKKVSSPILGVYYSDLIPVLIKATQEQQVIIEQQKEENLELKQQLEIQNEKLTNILKRLERIEENNK